MTTLDFVLTLLFIIIGLIALLIILIIFQKIKHSKKQKQVKTIRDFVFSSINDQKKLSKRFNKTILFQEFINIQEQVHIDNDAYLRFVSELKRLKVVKKQLKHLNSRFTFKRKKAVVFLGYLKFDDVKNRLIKQLKREKSSSIRLYLIHALKKDLSPELIATIIKSLNKHEPHYNQKITTLILNQPLDINKTTMLLKGSNESTVIRFLIACAKKYPTSLLRSYVNTVFKSTQSTSESHKLLTNLDEELVEEISFEAAATLAEIDPETLLKEQYFFNQYPEIVEATYQASKNHQGINAIDLIVTHFHNIQHNPIRVNTLKDLIYNNNKALVKLIHVFHQQNNDQAKEQIALALSGRIDYIIFNVVTSPMNRNFAIIKKLMDLEYYDSIINFVNQNKNDQYTREILTLFKVYLQRDTQLKNVLERSLKPSLLEKLGLSQSSQPPLNQYSAQKETDKKRYLLKWLVFSIVLFPIIFVIHSSLLNQTLFSQEAFFRFVIAYNLYIVAYYFSVNLIYIILSILSHHTATQQINDWSLKKPTLLYEDELLPKVSILAPAYNEELSIIESVTSLLNLKYPNYEVVVINDGSKDATLQTLIDHFHLEKHTVEYNSFITTRPIRGIYTTKNIPNLKVVDKHNGGKADALNVGINVSKYEYVCGIDADSVLESEALLKLLSVEMDQKKPLLASGGNILPSNGEIISQGKIEKRGLSKGAVVRFQSLEYLRAFTTGRLGWTKLNALLIISGAFGVFNKEALLQASGYLSRVSPLRKETVGEDMELVVRLHRNAKSENKDYKINYVYNAECHTQLPEEFSSLLKQRNRWHRGLLDILSYHRSMTFNPKYGSSGMIGFPYFLIYEMVGPLVEIQGYFFLFLALILGLLNLPIILLIFIATIGFGIVISLTSLLILEKAHNHLTYKEISILIFYGIFENFGYRQLMSLYRVRGYFSSLQEKHQWGEQKRKGFVKK